MPPKDPDRKKRAQEISWVKNPDLTDALVAYFVDNPQFRRSYFSDSVDSARTEKRTKKTSHDSKVAMNKTLATHIFANHPVFAEDFKADEGRYATSTSNRLARLKDSYKEHAEALGSTGIGLKREDVVEGSKIHNLHQEILKSFPWWYELDNMWHELPNFVPVAVSASDQGVDHAGDAKSLFSNTGNEELDAEEQAIIADDPSAALDADDPTPTGKEPAAAYEVSSASPISSRGSTPDKADQARAGRLVKAPGGNDGSTSHASSRAQSTAPATTRTPAQQVEKRAAAPGAAATPQQRPAAHARSASASAAASPANRQSPAAAPSGGRAAAKTPAKGKDRDTVATLKRMREGDTARLEQKDKLTHQENIARIDGAVTIKKRRLDLKEQKLNKKAEAAELQRTQLRLQLEDNQRQREFELEKLRLQLQLQQGGMGGGMGGGGMGGGGMGGAALGGAALGGGGLGGGGLGGGVGGGGAGADFGAGAGGVFDFGPMNF
ncbi:hypothetical protein AURDEDRAFT_164996 [Auricularia subglabra TFB-10046 SS5]|nr:hypothetical protein AURDEDRAFT_164996 [Auricularia subglabra TFB-10046 SS5]